MHPCLRLNTQGLIAFLSSQVFPFFVFLFSCLIFCVFILLLPAEFRQNESSDYKSFYAPVAMQILKGHGITYESGAPAIRYPPGFPLILAGLFGLAQVSGVSLDSAIVFFQVITMGFASLILYLISKEIWGENLAWITPLLWTTYPVALWSVKQPNSELPFMVALFSLVLLVIKPNSEKRTKNIVSGILAGAAMLIRPIAIGLPLIISLWLGWKANWKRSYWQQLALFFMGLFCIITPWEIWAYRVTEKWIPLSSGGLPSILDGLTFAINNEDRQEVSIPYGVQVLMHRTKDAYENNQLESVKDISIFVIQEFRDYPLDVLNLGLIKAARSWYATDSRRFEMLIIVVQLIYIISIICGSLVLWKYRIEQRPTLLLFVSITVYFWIMTATVLSIVRYMLPALGLLFTILPGAWICFRHLYTNKKPLAGSR